MKTNMTDMVIKIEYMAGSIKNRFCQKHLNDEYQVNLYLCKFDEQVTT